MFKKNGIAVLCALCLGTAAFSQNFTMFSAGHPVLEDLRYLSREAGKSLLSLTPPLSRDEVIDILESIDLQQLSAAGKKAHDRIKTYLHPEKQLGDEMLSFACHPSISIEGAFRTEPDIHWSPDTQDFSSALILPLELYAADRLYIVSDVILGRDPSGLEASDTSFFTNVPYLPQFMDMNMPLRAFISGGGTWWNAQLGRDRVSFGSGHTGNLAISDTPDYYDFFRYSLFSPNFKYSFFLTQLPLDVSDLLSESQRAEIYDEQADTLYSTTQRYLYMHRFDFRFYERISIGLSEGLLVGNAPLELRYLNPVNMFHSFFSWRDYDSWAEHKGDLNGSILALDLDWAITPSLALYGQFILNEYATPYELEHWPDDNSPNGLGWLGGLEYAHQLGTWRSLYYFETVWTDPYAYTLSSPFASYIWMRRLSELSSKDLRYTWLGHPEGRDTLLFCLGAQFSTDSLELSQVLSYVQRGEHGLAWDWESGSEAVEEQSPSGIVEKSISLSLKGSWALLPPLCLSSQIVIAMVQNNGHSKDVTRSGAEFSLSVAYTF